MIQLKLPMVLKCSNPACKSDAYQGQYFCSDTCYWQVERSIRNDPRPKKEAKP